MNHFLILTLPVVCEPALDLSHLQTRLLHEIRLLLLVEVGMIDVVEEPLLKKTRLVRLKRLHSLQAIVINLLHGNLRLRGKRYSSFLPLCLQLVVAGPVAFKLLVWLLVTLKFTTAYHLSVMRLIYRPVDALGRQIMRRILRKDLLHWHLWLHLAVKFQGHLLWSDHRTKLSVKRLGRYLIHQLLLATDVG